MARRLVERLPGGITSYISCDEEVGALLKKPEIQRDIDELGRAHGRELLREGNLDRKELRELLFENSVFRGKVEGILHPLVLDRVNARSETWSDLVRISIVEVPLLYEVEFPLDRDMDLVVASSRTTQRKRLVQGRNLEEGVAEKIIGAQLPVEEKMQRANVVVWNDGAIEALFAQTDHLVSRCDRMVTE